MVDAVNVSGDEWRVSDDGKTWTTFAAKAGATKSDVLAEWVNFVSGPPIVETLEDQKSTALLRLKQAHSDFLQEVIGQEMTEERDTWPAKERAARLVMVGNPPATDLAMIEAEAAGRGMSVVDLCALIVAKASAYKAQVGAAAGVRFSAGDAIDAATDATEVDTAASTALATFRDLRKTVGGK